MDIQQAQAVARTILDGFERHYRLFQQITAGAKRRFEAADWSAVQRVSRERIHYYDQRVDETLEHLRDHYGIRDLDEALWRRIKIEYVHLLHQHRQPELAETYFNSVFCHLFHRRYYNNHHIFVRPAVSTEHLELEVPTWASYYPAREGLHRVLTRMLKGCGFTLPFEDRRRDLRNLLRAVRDRVPAGAAPQQNFQIAVLDCLFYRNKAAYLIGKLVNGADEIPFAIPILNNERGALFVDTLLAGESELANLFSFARSYFMVDTPVPSVVVEFLSRVLPCKTKADLYTTIGLQKHGKTEFYRDFLRHLGHSSDEFVVAPGMRGLVMAVFTLPSYPYVFKVIRDHFPPPKETTRTAVMAKYRLVKEHDRVGRMADSLEYSDAAFPLARFSEQLRRELAHEAASGIEIDGDQLVIRHLYIERRMTPLNVFLHRADDAAQQTAMDDYGRAIRELAAANIFPGDMLLKNFGVTRQGRVVFYDYDDICYLTECNFRRIPEPPCPEFEFAAEPWYSVEQADVFPEEFATFLVSSPRLRAAFLAGHAELLDPRWWQARQAGATAGRFEDVFPYPQASRFVRTLHHHRPPLPSPADEIPSAACG